MAKITTIIKDVDLTFQNTPTKIMANHNSSKIELAGTTVGPLEEGQEYEVPFWVAQELVKVGLARFKEEETLDSVKLHKIYWKERIQPLGQVAPLPENFYPKLRRFIAKLKNEALKNPEKRVEYEKILGISRDIVNCRLRKIVSLSSAQVKNTEITRNLTKEEQALYEQLYEISNKWRANILAEGEI